MRGREHRPSLLADTGGATMVAGIFMAALLVGLLFHVVLLGQSIAYRDRVDAAGDRVAFEAAVGHARSVNEIALANNIQMIAVANVFALETARINLEVCAEAAVFGGREYQDCPRLLDELPPRYAAVRPLVRLVREMTDVGARVADATPELVQEEARRAFVTVPLERRNAVHVDAAPLPVETGSMLVQCTRTQGLVSELLDASYLPPALVALFLRPPRRPSPAPLDCPAPRLLPGIGPTLVTERSGSEPMQVRGVVVGPRRPWSRGERSNGLMLLGRLLAPDFEAESRDLPNRAREELARLSLTQAEYYSDWEHANRLTGPDLSEFPYVMPEEDSFYMHWRARLRRLRVPVDVATWEADARFAEYVRSRWVPACDAACSAMPSCTSACDEILRLEAMGNHASR